MENKKNYKDYTKEELILRLETMDGLIEQLQKETNEEELPKFPWAGNLGQWNWMIPNNKLVFNEKKATNLGYAREEIPKKTGFEFFTSKLHPDDYERVMDNMRRHLMNLSPAYEVEYRIQKNNGDYAWYYDRGTVTKRSEDGEALIITGIVFDISRTKKIKKELREVNSQLRHLAQTDDLTSAYNRRYMTEKLVEEMACLSHNDSALSLMMIDLDNFKSINDEFGHQTGDELLKYFVRVIDKSIAKEDLISRWGGDEFLVLLKNQNIDQAKIISEGIRLTLDETKKDKFKNVTVSIGLAELNQKTELEEAINLVDNLMYKAKLSGKNKVAF